MSEEFKNPIALPTIVVCRKCRLGLHLCGFDRFPVGCWSDSPDRMDDDLEANRPCTGDVFDIYVLVGSGQFTRPVSYRTGAPEFKNLRDVLREAEPERQK